MFELFVKGGPIMWPLLLTSIAALSVVFERVWFIYTERQARDEARLGTVLACLEKGDREQALKASEESNDPVVRTLAYGLSQSPEKLSQALMKHASHELARYRRGLTVLDTSITLAPLLGLLGTVTGMIKAFAVLGENQLGAPTAITGGIAEALIATCFGLGIAVIALIPFNFLNARVDRMRESLEDAATQAEILVHKAGDPS